MEEVVQQIYQLVKKKMREQGAYDRDSYSQLVDETIAYFYEKGKLGDDENEEFIKDQLLQMWEAATEQMADE